jgi:hypothetical protein
MLSKSYNGSLVWGWHLVWFCIFELFAPLDFLLDGLGESSSSSSSKYFSSFSLEHSSVQVAMVADLVVLVDSGLMLCLVQA